MQTLPTQTALPEPALGRSIEMKLSGARLTNAQLVYVRAALRAAYLTGLGVGMEVSKGDCSEMLNDVAL